MQHITKINYREEVEGKTKFKNIEFPTVYDQKYYDKYYGLSESKYCFSEEIAECKRRYIEWADRNKIVLSGHWKLVSLKKSIWGCQSSYPRFFDHTTFWRRKSERFPIFCLTEPYDYKANKAENEWDQPYDLEMKFFPQSEKSLWYPNSTAMIFIYDPTKWEFDPKLME